MKHLEDKIYATATINAENGRLALNLFHDTDDRYRWYEATGADTEISGEGPTDAEEAAQQAWRNWDFVMGPRIPFTHGAALKKCMNCGAELDGTENPADFCDSDCEENYYEED